MDLPVFFHPLTSDRRIVVLYDQNGQAWTGLVEKRVEPGEIRVSELITRYQR